MNDSSLSNLSPSGKIKKTPKPKKVDSKQLSLFVGLTSVDGSGWLQHTFKFTYDQKKDADICTSPDCCSSCLVNRIIKKHCREYVLSRLGVQ